MLSGYRLAHNYISQFKFRVANSKHWFTTSFPQPLPYLVTPYGSRKLSAQEQFFCWCSNSSKFVTYNSNKTRRVIYSRQQLKFTPARIKPQSYESRRNIVQELCESRGGRPGLSVLTSLLSGFRGRKDLLHRASALVTTCP